MLVMYPAIFHRLVKGSYMVVFPDVNEANSVGDTMDEAIEIAQRNLKDVLQKNITKGESLPLVSDIDRLEISLNEEQKKYFIEGKSFKDLISVDVEAL